MTKRKAPGIEPPFPPADLRRLAAALGRLPRPVSLVGWDECPPLHSSPSPGSTIPGATFDVRAVVRVVRAMCDLKHTKGRWAGTPFVPSAWQIVWVIAPVFGWKYPLDYSDEELAGTRIVRTAFVEIPRKAGKSSLSSAFALVLVAADGEMGAEVYAAASTKGQAGIVFGEAKKMALASPVLRGRMTPLKEVLEFPATASIFRVLSKVADAAHGLNVSGAVIDELHVHRTRDLVDAIETGVGARLQPLIVIITTADEGADGTIYAEKHDRAVNSANGVLVDPAFWGVIWAAPANADPFDEATWVAAQPGLGKTVTKAYYRENAERARTSPSYLPTFLRLFLNVRHRQTVPWLRLDLWDDRRNTRRAWLPADGWDEIPQVLRGRRAWAGLDLSTTTDLTAMVLWVPDDDERAGWAIPWFWLPEADLHERVQRDQVPYDLWAEAGHLQLTEGNVVDYDRVVEVLARAGNVFDLQRVSHDRWQAGQIVQHLGKHSIDTNPVPQSYGGMSAAAKELERLVVQGAWRHGAHPVLRWNASVVEVMRDTVDNIRPVKPNRQKSTARVDGVTAAVMAVDGWMRREVRFAPATGAPAPSTDQVFRPTERLRI
jgi:phage terminase large subunit-like protein